MSQASPCNSMTVVSIGCISIEGKESTEKLIKIIKKLLKDKTIKEYLALIKSEALMTSCDYTG